MPAVNPDVGVDPYPATYQIPVNGREPTLSGGHRVPSHEA